jgi:predicted transcriptional regulator
MPQLAPGKRNADAEAYRVICESGEDGISYNDLKSLRVNRVVQRLMLLGMIHRKKVGPKKFVYLANKTAVDFRPKH